MTSLYLGDDQQLALKNLLGCGTANPPLTVLHCQSHSLNRLLGLAQGSYGPVRPRAVQTGG